MRGGSACAIGAKARCGAHDWIRTIYEASRQAAFARPVRLLALLPSKKKSVQLTSRIRLTPENYWSVLVLGSSQNVMKLDSESVEMPDVQRSEIVMECVVQEAVID